MMTMIERVARAICAEEYGGGEDNWLTYRRNAICLARVAIIAMQEPTEAMLVAANDADYYSPEGQTLAWSTSLDDDFSGIKAIYRDMIAAALKEDDMNVKFHQINEQQLINLYAVASIDFFGHDGEVTLTTGRKYRLSNAEFVALGKAMNKEGLNDVQD